MLAPTDFLDTLRLPAQEAIDLLDARGAAHADTRGEPYRRPRVPLLVRHRTGEEARYLVFASRLWAGGMSVLHGGYIHPGVRATVSLDGEAGSRDLESTVIHSSHLQGRAHLLELSFESPLDPDEVGALADQHQAAAPEATPDPASIVGSVLHIDDSVMDFRLLAHHVGKTGVSLSHAETGAAALERVRDGAFDAVLCDMNLGDTCGEHLIGQLRAKKFRGPIAVVTGVQDKSRLRAAVQAGACDLLLKPFQSERLLQCLGRMLAPAAKARKAAPDAQARKAAPADPMRRHAARMDARTIRTAMADLPRAITARDYDLVERLCEELRAASDSLGVDDVAKAAGAVLQSLRRSGSVVGAAADLRSLIERCQAHLAA